MATPRQTDDMTPIDRDEFSNAVTLIRNDIAGVHSRLDALNGRTRRSEERLAVVETKIDGHDKAISPQVDQIAGVRDRIGQLEARVAIYAAAAASAAWFLLEKAGPAIVNLARGG